MKGSSPPFTAAGHRRMTVKPFSLSVSNVCVGGEAPVQCELSKSTSSVRLVQLLTWRLFRLKMFEDSQKARVADRQ